MRCWAVENHKSRACARDRGGAIRFLVRLSPLFLGAMFRRGKYLCGPKAVIIIVLTLLWQGVHAASNGMGAAAVARVLSRPRPRRDHRHRLLSLVVCPVGEWVWERLAPQRRS